MNQAHHPFVIEDGHEYSFPNVGTGLQAQALRFIKRSGGSVQYGTTEHPEDHPGTNVQSMIRVLIDRTKYLDALVPCVENGDVLHHLRMVLLSYEGRAWRRKNDKVNRGSDEHHSFRERDKDLPFDEMGFKGDPSYKGIEELPCGKDGHIIVPDEEST